jgi:hypothetical protein
MTLHPEEMSDLVRKCDKDCPQIHQRGQDYVCFFREHKEVQPGQDCRYGLGLTEVPEPYGGFEKKEPLKIQEKTGGGRWRDCITKPMGSGLGDNVFVYE